MSGALLHGERLLLHLLSESVSIGREQVVACRPGAKQLCWAQQQPCSDLFIRLQGLVNCKDIDRTDCKACHGIEMVLPVPVKQAGNVDGSTSLRTP